MKRVLVYMLAGMALVGTSCSDFLEMCIRDRHNLANRKGC